VAIIYLFLIIYFSASLEKQLAELVAEPSDEFKKFTRMSLLDFEKLLSEVSPLISKQNTQLRKAIPAKTRLAITLRFLATGDSLQSLHFLFKVSPQLISQIIPEVCQALNQVLQAEIKVIKIILKHNFIETIYLYVN
jgi:paraquat-inducible protein B